MIVGFTGSRPQKLGGYVLPNDTYIKICKETENILLKLKPDKCISGFALGYDQYATNVCIKNNIKYIAALPFIGQDLLWTTEYRRIYKLLLSKAEEIIIVSEGGYSAQKLQIRNEYIVDNCDVLIACFDGSPSGTGNCVAYAEAKNKTIYRIIP